MRKNLCDKPKKHKTYGDFASPDSASQQMPPFEVVILEKKDGGAQQFSSLEVLQRLRLQMFIVEELKKYYGLGSPPYTTFPLLRLYLEKCSQ